MGAIIMHDTTTTVKVCLVPAAPDAEKPRLARAVTEKRTRWA